MTPHLGRKVLQSHRLVVFSDPMRKSPLNKDTIATPQQIFLLMQRHGSLSLANMFLSSLVLVTTSDE